MFTSFKAGKCRVCKCEEVVITTSGSKNRTGLCKRCEPESFNELANMQKDDWMKGNYIRNGRFRNA